MPLVCVRSGDMGAKLHLELPGCCVSRCFHAVVGRLSVCRRWKFVLADRSLPYLVTGILVELGTFWSVGDTLREFGVVPA